MRTKQSITKFALFVVGALALSIVTLSSSLSAANAVSQRQSATAEPQLSDHQKQMIAAFNSHVKDYLEQRNQARKKVPPLSKDATPEQIDAHQKAFVEVLKAMRTGTKQGYMFLPEFASYVRALVKAEFKGRERVELRETVLEAETKGVPLRVNYPYPETKEVTVMPATLLLKLPQLPKEVRYRFVGRHMLLVDTDNGLIVDYMLNALP